MHLQVRKIKHCKAEEKVYGENPDALVLTTSDGAIISDQIRTELKSESGHAPEFVVTFQLGFGMEIVEP